jgi:hypothetical protein
MKYPRNDVRQPETRYKIVKKPLRLVCTVCSYEVSIASTFYSSNQGPREKGNSRRQAADLMNEHIRSKHGFEA